MHTYNSNKSNTLKSIHTYITTSLRIMEYLKSIEKLKLDLCKHFIIKICIKIFIKLIKYNLNIIYTVRIS